MKRYEQLYYNKIYKKKYILLLDKNNDEIPYNSYSNIYMKDKNIVDKEEKNNKKKKDKINKKKFKILRNFSSKFKKGFLTLESPHKSIFAKRILSEIIPHNLSKKNLIFKPKKKIFENDANLLILNTPKANNSFFSKNYFSKDSKTYKKTFNDFRKKRNSHNINANISYLFNIKKSNISKTLSLTKNPLTIDQHINDNENDNDNKDDYIQYVIKEDNNNSEENKSDLEEKEKNNNYKKSKINLRKIPFLKPKKLILKNIKDGKDRKKGMNYSQNKKNKIPKNKTPNLYLKKCNMKKHYSHEKFVNKFLTPLNKFMNVNFQFTIKEYEKLNKKIHDSNYLINNNEYSLYKHKRKKEKYKEFIPPKIPNIQNIIENKYMSNINKLKNYKFKL